MRGGGRFWAVAALTLASFAEMTTLVGQGTQQSLNGGAQEAPQLNAGPTYTSGDGMGAPKFPDVEVVYTLAAPDGTPTVTKPSDLRLFSQGNEVGTANSLRTFEQAGYGLTAILALDASGSMKGAPLAAIHASIARFVDQARAQDQVEVLTFADQTQIDVPFGASKESLTQELTTVEARGKFTRLYDGLLDALQQFKAAQPKRRQILVISDGHDEGSTHQLSDVVLQARRLGVVINSIGLTRDAGEYLYTLHEIAEQTGGSYRRALTAQDLEGLIGQGIESTRATPIASFRTSHLAADDSLHAVQLHWLPGSLSAPAFVQTPKGSSLENVALNDLHRLNKVKKPSTSTLWYWGLGGCFVAGLVLLILSWWGLRGKKGSGNAPPSPMAAPAPWIEPPTPGFGVQPLVTAAPPPPPMPIQQLGINESRVPREPMYWHGVRTATQPESEPNAPDFFASSLGPHEPVADAISAGMQSSGTQDSGQEGSHGAGAFNFGPAPERARTHLAAFFEAPPAGPYARLEVRTGAMEGQSVPVTLPTFSLGATAGTDLVLPEDSTVSARHARLLWEASILKIEDLNSTNGTYVNSNRLEAGRHLLKPGDEIRLGRTILTVTRA